MMTSIISIAIATAVLWLAYRVLFINSNRLVFNRVFLIVALGFSLILPFVGGFIGRNVPQVTNYRESILQGIMLEEIVITPDGVVINTASEVADTEAVTDNTVSNKAPLNLIGLIRLIWLIGLIGAALIFLLKLGRILFIIIKSPKKKMQGFTAVFTGKEHGPYSFFNYAFFTDENVSEEIVRHEMSHIEHHHSADIIFVELMMILQWFNPFIYLYKRELQSLHEYMADHDVVATGVDKKNYMMLILQQCTAADFSGMSNNFSLILTKKRIKMITQNKKAKGVIVKALLTLPVFALLIFANCQSNGQTDNKVKSPDETTMETQSMTVFKVSDGTYISLSDPLDITIDGTHLILNLNSVKNDTTIMIGEHELVAKNNHDERNSFSLTLDGEAFDINFLGGILANNEEYHPQGEDEVFTGAVEKMPEFPGGVNALMAYLRGNLKYPESAKKNKQEGRVFIGFVVEKDGSISNVSVMRGVCEELDNEAVRVVKAMPRWTPGMNEGKPVRVQYTLPIVFKLNGETAVTSLTGTHWEGIGSGIDEVEGTKFVMSMSMDFYNDNDGLFVMKLTAQGKDSPAAQTVFENVALDFKYTFDGKSTGSIQPKNPDGSDLGEAQPPYGFVVKGDKIIVNFYDFKEDCGIESITFMKK
ncbi:MAG: M56 family metallopeptidase [Bacteroidales bacterium]|nr:M56 family metallopeptidase [Bacteroidales bacterium]